MKDKVHPKYYTDAKVFYRGEVVMTVGATVPASSGTATWKVPFAPVLHRPEIVCRYRRPGREVPAQVRRRLLQRQEEVGPFH